MGAVPRGERIVESGESFLLLCWLDEDGESLIAGGEVPVVGNRLSVPEREGRISAVSFHRS